MAGHFQSPAAVHWILEAYATRQSPFQLRWMRTLPVFCELNTFSPRVASQTCTTISIQSVRYEALTIGSFAGGHLDGLGEKCLPSLLLRRPPSPLEAETTSPKREKLASLYRSEIRHLECAIWNAPSGMNKNHVVAMAYHIY